MTIRKFLFGLVSAIAASTVMAWPTKPITIVVPFPAGGTSDLLARAVSTHAGESLGHRIIVDNRTGASGTLAAAFVARSPADGYTFMVSGMAPFVTAPHLMRVQYDAVRDLEPISLVVRAAKVLVVPTASPHRNLSDFISWKRANPGSASFASAGNGSSDHLTAELFWQETRTTGIHIPYRGGAPAVTAVLGGEVNALFMSINAVMPHIQSGRLRPLVISSATRSSALPQVPTLMEQGVNFTSYSWQGFASPRGIPAEARRRMHELLSATLRNPEMHSRLTQQGLEIVLSTPEEFATFQQSEFSRWKQIIETRNIVGD
ncbi:MAG: tripartite tricarboxylate transporter substrate binding protein [Betaproteobacteria bacterium]|nr:tripartite tricarboxylate transporter substrate binding protein [Betaproteobacteria bacterium]